MNDLFNIINKFLDRIFNAFGSSKARNDTDRILLLIKMISETDVDKTEPFLIDAYYRRLSKELYGIELNKMQLEIAEKTIKKSNYSISWETLKFGIKFIKFIDNKIVVDEKKWKTLWFSVQFIIGSILIISPIILDFFVSFNELKNIQQKLLFKLIFFIILVFPGILILWKSAAYFTARSIDLIIKKPL